MSNSAAKLQRTRYTSNGIFGKLIVPYYLFYTLEHAYQIPGGWWRPKLPEGTYTCVRGWHQLPGSKDEINTFEITGVPDHTGILFHPGNFNRDSEGCVLVGESADETAIIDSQKGFDQFLNCFLRIDSFVLTVD